MTDKIICQRCNINPAEKQDPTWLPICHDCNKEINALPHRQKLDEMEKEWKKFRPGKEGNPMSLIHITIVDPGNTTFKRGEIISQEAFDKENERVSKLGEKTAVGMYFNEAGESIEAVYNANGKPPEIPITTPIKPKPTRDDVRVEVWEERDRLLIGIQDKKTGDYYASWWDDNAREMFTDGFFKSGSGLEESVLQYAEAIGLLKK